MSKYCKIYWRRTIVPASMTFDLNSCVWSTLFKLFHHQEDIKLQTKHAIFESLTFIGWCLNLMKVGILWLLFSPSVSLPPSPTPCPPFPGLCFGSPPRTSSVFVSHCINSVMVMSGMCINSDLPSLCLPLPLLSLSPPPHGVLIHCCSFVSPLLSLSPSLTPYPSPPMTLNPRMTPITRTCWCVRVPWEWPPVSLPPWEASPALFPQLTQAQVCGQLRPPEITSATHGR